MKPILKKTVLLPLLATLATAPLCTSAHANPWYTLGMGWWIIPVAVGGVAAYEVANNQVDEGQKATYTNPNPQTVHMQPQRTYVMPASVYYLDQPTTYYQQQYGYVLAVPGVE